MTTGTNSDVPPSSLGPVGKDKLIIVSDIYSENGGVDNRDVNKVGNYVLGHGGASDILRDFLGKVWTKTDAAPGNPSKLAFLNPDMGANSSNIPLNMPCDVYVDDQYQVGDKVWPEYQQNMYIDPDPGWLFDNIADKGMNAGEMFNDVNREQLRSGVIQILQNKSMPSDAIIAGASEQVVTFIRDWWRNVMKFTNSPPLPDGVIDSGLMSPLFDAGPWYEDYSYIISVPMSVKEADKMLGLKPLIADLSSVYNFYIRSYECECKTGVKEQILPNIYAFISSYIPENYGDGTPQTSGKFEDLISLNKLLKNYDGSSLVVSDPSNFAENNLIPSGPGNYYRTWANAYKNATPDDLATLDPLAKKYTNLLFPLNDTGMLKYYNNLRFMFPMYNELKFSTGVLTQFGDLMRSTLLGQHFMYYYLTRGTKSQKNYLTNSWIVGTSNEHETNNPGALRKTETFMVQETVSAAPTSGGGWSSVSNSYSVGDKSMTVLTLEAWLGKLELIDVIGNTGDDDPETFLERGYDPGKAWAKANAVFMTKNENEDLIDIKAGNKLQRAMLGAIFFGKARKIAKERLRSYGDLCKKGKPAYSETLMYKVEKFIVESTPNVPQQTFYFLNSSEIDILKFIDTQVTYNVKYSYKISAIQLVLGTDYRYHGAPNFVEFDAPSQEQYDTWSEVWGDVYEAAKAGSYQEQQGEFETVDKGGKWTYKYRQDAMDECDAGGWTYLHGWQIGKIVSPDSPYFGLIDPCGCAKTLIKWNIDKHPWQTCIEAHQGILNEEMKKCCPDNVIDEGGTVPPVTWENPNPNYPGGTPGLELLEKNGTSLLTKIKVVYKPSYKIVETPYTTVEGRILDKPPIFPDVNLVPYKGVNNKLLVNLNSSVGEYHMMPIAFSGEEESEIALQRESQQIMDETKPIKFKSDDTVAYGGFFQIYRMEKKPQEYRDFEKHLHQTLRTQVGDSLWSEAAALSDDIKPNKKYYYTFRVVDVHGNSSNPSAVFEVEMIDNGGAVYLRQRVIELKPPENKTPYKSLKKYIQIKPPLAQRVLDAKGLDFANATSAFNYMDQSGPLKLGMQDESVWGKKFKIRLTSKSTGKQIDLNVNFVLSTESELELMARTAQEASAVDGIQASAGGFPAANSMEKSGQPGNPLEGW